jgi:predicted nucleic acid-binding protein
MWRIECRKSTISVADSTICRISDERSSDPNLLSDIVRIEPVDLLGAIDLHRLHGFSIWDALILRAALVSGCRTLYTEDLQHGFKIESLEVVNPFV